MQEKGKKRATRETTDGWPVPHPKMCFILNAIGGHEADRRASDRLVLTRAQVGQDDPNVKPAETKQAIGNAAVDRISGERRNGERPLDRLEISFLLRPLFRRD